MKIVWGCQSLLLCEMCCHCDVMPFVTPATTSRERCHVNTALGLKLTRASRTILTNNLPWAAEDGSLWQLPRSPDSQSPWWWSPPRWAGWLLTGREGMMIAWQSFPGSLRATLPLPVSHILPAAEETQRGKGVKAVSNVATLILNRYTQSNTAVHENICRLLVCFSNCMPEEVVQRLKRENQKTRNNWDKRSTEGAEWNQPPRDPV